MRGPHVRFCERRGGAILRAYSTVTPPARAIFQSPPLAVVVGLATIPSSLFEGRFVAWPSRHRPSDEDLHERASDPRGRRRGGQGRVLHRGGLSVRKGPAIAIPEASTAQSPAPRSSCRCLGWRDPRHAGGRAGGT